MSGANNLETPAMKVATICKRGAVTVTPRQEIIAAAALMRERHVGFLVVVEQHGRPVGVLTDRAIVVSVVAKGADPSLLTVGDIMTEDPITAHEDDSVEHALRTMHRLGVHRLPVVGAKGQLTGVLSFDDVLDVIAAEMGEVSGAVHSGQQIEGALRPEDTKVG
jgi:CBS domain-containing protein